MNELCNGERLYHSCQSVYSRLYRYRNFVYVHHNAESYLLATSASFWFYCALRA